MRRIIVLLVGLVVLVAACTSSDDTTTTTLATDGEDGTTTTLDGDGVTDGELTEAAVEEMCRTLSLFSAAATPPQNVAQAMMFVDLADATSQEMAAYGDLLIGAPAEGCPQQQRYAEAIQYWLGF